MDSQVNMLFEKRFWLRATPQIAESLPLLSNCLEGLEWHDLILALCHVAPECKGLIVPAYKPYDGYKFRSYSTDDAVVIVPAALNFGYNHLIGADKLWRQIVLRQGRIGRFRLKGKLYEIVKLLANVTLHRSVVFGLLYKAVWKLPDSKLLLVDSAFAHYDVPVIRNIIKDTEEKAGEYSTLKNMLTTDVVSALAVLSCFRDYSLTSVKGQEKLSAGDYLLYSSYLRLLNASPTRAKYPNVNITDADACVNADGTINIKELRARLSAITQKSPYDYDNFLDSLIRPYTSKPTVIAGQKIYPSSHNAAIIPCVCASAAFISDLLHFSDDKREKYVNDVIIKDFERNARYYDYQVVSNTHSTLNYAKLNLFKHLSNDE